MIRKENDRPGGRRPLLLIGNNRQMLNEIRDSLSHLRKQDVDGEPLKTELSQNPANSLDKTSAGSKMTRRDNQHHKALAEIRDSLRPYQNASQPVGATGGGGSGACSDNSSTTSSTSESETNQSMVQQIMAYGFEEDIAVQALKLSGNQSAAAALRLLVYIMDEKIGPKAGLPPHSFAQRHFGPSSPAPSETNSVRSESPSQNFAPPRRLLVNGQTPPPLPPRIPITTQANPSAQGQGQMTTVSAGSELGNKPGAPVAQKPLQPANAGFLQTLGKGQIPASMIAQSQLVGQNNNVVPQGHVQQIIQLMAPGQQAYLLQQKQQQQQQQQQQHQPQQHQMNGGGGLVGVPAQRGVSPITASTPLYSQQMQNLLLGAPPASSPTPSSCPSPAPSSNSGQMPVLTRGMAPPPYSQAQAQIQAGRLGGMVSPNPTPSMEPAHRPSPGLDMQSEAQQLLHKNLVPPSAVSATRRPMGSSHMPVIMPSVTSKQVQKPVPQTATPVVTSNHLHHNGVPPGSGHVAPNGAPQPGGPLQQHINGPSLVSGHPNLNGLNQAHLKSLAALKSASSQGQPTKAGEVQIQLSHSYHQGLRRNGALQYPSPEHAGQPTVHTVRARRQYTNTPSTTNNSNPPQHPVGVKLTNGHAAFYPPFPGDLTTPRSDSPVSRTTNQSPLSTTSSPSTNSDIPDKPPPPYPGPHLGMAGAAPLLPPRVPLREKPPPPPPPAEQEVAHLPPHSAVVPQAPPTHLSANFPQVPGSSSSSPSPSSPGLNFPGGGVPVIPVSTVDTVGSAGSPNLPGPQVASSAPPSETDETDTDTSSHASSKLSAPKNNEKPHRCMSPLPERRSDARERDRLRCDTKVRMYSPQAFKFYMEQHVENVLKSHSERLNRGLQLEKEMAKVNLSEEAARQMRKMLHQKESNYIRLKRAKMDSSMFEKITALGVGAFGEVYLVRKKDVGSLYAMKTLKKSNVIKRNQVAHVKAERDILAEADNEWVVKLYYSFQDKDHLYFVMDYVPGGDLMNLLIHREILEEPLAQFYIAELVLAIESVHRMGFIHRDIKPDNILIDKDGHIKLTDFGLCTGFRWTHDSKYYQKDGSHARQDSMEVSNNCQFDDQCHCEILKPLEQRRQREMKRCLAHSLVGTPNYIAPEVLRRLGYTKACDWWSVGVILYEMVIGQPPFYANTPAETQYKVINWEKTLTVDQHRANISTDTADLILKLLQGPETRLGRNGAQEVKEHAFFRGINFEGLRRQPAPLKPTIRYPTDTSNFDPVDPDKLRTNDSEGSKKVDSKLENGKHPEHAFYEFTFRRFFDDGGHPCSMPSNPETESNSPVYV